MMLSRATAAEEAERQTLIEEARTIGAAAISQSTVTAAQAIIGAVAARGSGTALGEPGRDLRAIRLDPALNMSIDVDKAAGAGAVRRLMAEAIVAGYRTAADMRAVPLGLTVTVTDEDRADLASLPVAGFTVEEWAEDYARSLARDVALVLSLPLTSTVDPASLPTELSRAAEAIAGRLAAAVEQAHLAGVAAAVRGIGQALAGKG